MNKPLLLLLVFTLVAQAEDQMLTTKLGEVKADLFLPDGVKIVRGLFVHAANYKLSAEDRWADACRRLGFGHLSLDIDRGSNNRPRKLRQALDQVLPLFAAQSGHPELPLLPMAGIGHSAGGWVNQILLQTPERAITTVVDCAWVLDPAKLREADRSVPQLFTLGAVPDAFNMLPDIEKHYVPARAAGYPWGLGVKWGCAHDFGNAATLFFPWLEAVIALRLPTEPPAPGQSVMLRELPLEAGWLGDRGTVDGHWATIAPYAEYRGEKAQAAWFPNRAVAHVWRAFQSKDAPVVLEATTADGQKRLPPFDLKAGRELRVDQGTNLQLSGLAPEGFAIRKLEFFDGDQSLGEATAAPWTFSWRAPAPGHHAVSVQWETPDGKRGVANPALFIVPLPKP